MFFVAVINTAQKMFPADLVTFTGEIFKKNFIFCAVKRENIILFPLKCVEIQKI